MSNANDGKIYQRIALALVHKITTIKCWLAAISVYVCSIVKQANIPLKSLIMRWKSICVQKTIQRQLYMCVHWLTAK